VHVAVSDPAAIPALLDALRVGECVAHPEGDDGVAVVIPWLRGSDDASQALIELTFFIRAWASHHPGVDVRLAA
jgi:hypothetical protein